MRVFARSKTCHSAVAAARFSTDGGKARRQRPSTTDGRNDQLATSRLRVGGRDAEVGETPCVIEVHWLVVIQHTITLAVRRAQRFSI